MINKVIRFVKENKLIDKKDKLIIGVSGGADSVCLLLVLNELKTEYELSLTVVTVNHHIRGEEALRDVLFVENMCNQLGVNCIKSDVDVITFAENEKMSEEEAARILRYQEFYRIKDQLEADKIAVAHNLNDNSETILFNIFRGTGIKGLTGMNPRRDHIIRPLLSCSRPEIENYLDENNICYITDSTNNSTEYSRNKLRLDIIPEVKKHINEKADYNIVGAAKNLAVIYDFMEEEADKAYEKYVTGGLIQEEGLKLHAAILSMLVRRVIENKAGKLKDITQNHIESVMALKDMQVSKSVNLPYGLIAIRKYDGISIDVEKETTDTFIEKDVLVDGIAINNKYVDLSIYESNMDHKNIVDVQYTKLLDYDKINRLTVRNRRAGDYIMLSPDGGKKKLKDYFIDLKIPKEERDKILLVADGSHVAWIIGYRISAYYKINENTANVIEIKCKMQEET